MPKKSLLPLLILGSGFIWAACFEWLRRRNHHAAGSPQHLTWIGMAGLVVCMIAAGIAAYIKWLA